MFSMAVAAVRKHRFVVAAVVAAALLVPGAAVAAAAAPAAQAAAAVPAVQAAAAVPAVQAAAAVPAAQASVSHSTLIGGYGGSRAGNAALNWAERHATGCWYYYGGASCSPGYDCSGLVMEAFGHGAGIWLPHSTYAMLNSPRLHWIPLSQARRGDLMFYGSGHVEIKTKWYHGTFGAHDWGQRVGWATWGPWWYPTAAYRVW